MNIRACVYQGFDFQEKGPRGYSSVMLYEGGTLHIVPFDFYPDKALVHGVLQSHDQPTPGGLVLPDGLLVTVCRSQDGEGQNGDDMEIVVLVQENPLISEDKHKIVPPDFFG